MTLQWRTAWTMVWVVCYRNTLYITLNFQYQMMMMVRHIHIYIFMRNCFIYVPTITYIIIFINYHSIQHIHITVITLKNLEISFLG